MKFVSRRLSVPVLGAVLLFTSASALAQFSNNSEDRRPRRERAHQQDSKEEARFPKATRKAPDARPSKEGAKTLDAIIKLYQAKDYPPALQQSKALAADSSAGVYERAFASYLAGTIEADTKDYAVAAQDFQNALQLDALGNNDHYQVMYNLAVVQYQLQDSAAALATLDRYTKETGVDPSQTNELRAALLVDVKRPQEAAALFRQAWQADQSDTKALNNAVALYQQGGDFQQANALLLDAKAKGLLDDKGYQVLYVGYLSLDDEKSALATIEEGLANGKLQPDERVANAYTVIAQNAYADGDSATAIAMYRKAAPIAKDGEPALNLARVLMNEGRLAEAKQAARQALDKGLKKPADAQKIIARSGK